MPCCALMCDQDHVRTSSAPHTRGCRPHPRPFYKDSQSRFCVLGTGDAPPALWSSQANQRLKCHHIFDAIGPSCWDMHAQGVAGSKGEGGVHFNLWIEGVRHSVTENLSP